jgi:hypothetical protein
MDEMQKAAEELTQKTNKPLDEKARTFIIDLMKGQRPPEFIVDKLVQNGYDYQQSYDYTHSLYSKVSDAVKEKDKKGATWNIVLGLIILIVGIAITASGSGVIAYGAILVGAVKLIKGIADAA